MFARMQFLSDDKAAVLLLKELRALRQLAKARRAASSALSRRSMLLASAAPRPAVRLASNSR